MIVHRNILVLCLAAAALAFVGCGDDEVSAAAATRLCKAACEKGTTCVSSPITIDCDTQCKATGGGSGSTDCDVSSSQVNSCAADIEAQSCADFTSGKTPSSCDFCPSSGTPDASGDSSTTFPDTSSATGTCDDLSECCPKITQEGTKLGCEQTVALGADATCAQALAGLKAAGLCN
jgi:hypothetical protein